MTGPSITLGQISNAMINWSKIVDPNKLILGVRLHGIIELTESIEGNLENNSTVPRDSNTTISKSVIGEPYRSSALPYIDACTFKEDYSLKVGSCSAIRSTKGPLINSCTAGNGWTRKFDSNSNSTFLYKVSNTSLVVGSPTPLSKYFYITYEDSQSIQYKTQIIVEKTYGGIALSGLTDGCDDIIHSINAILPVSGFSPPPKPKSSTSTSSVIIVVIVCLVLCCGGFGGKKYYLVERRTCW
jgi:hypothetical protein